MNVDLESLLASLGPARRFADPEGQPAARLMAARGALPLPPEQISSVLFALTLDPDPAIADTADASLGALPARVLDVALESALHCALLDRFAHSFREDEARLEKIALNAAVADETFCFLASLPLPRLIDIVARNQTRLMRCADLVEILGQNPATSHATLDRVLEFLGVSQDKPDEEAPPEPETEIDDLADLPALLTQEAAEGEGDDVPSDEEHQGNLMALVQEMKVVEKIKLARFGNKEARTLLMRDRNRIVAVAAIRSPKVSESEVLAATQSRNLAEDVLRVISNTREWTKLYPVKLALARNPKAPLAAAIKFLNYLTDRDLKAIMRSRDVPGPVAQQARRILARKGKQ